MITAIIQIKLSDAITLEKATGLFSGSAHKYQDTPGLIRKYYLLSEDRRAFGGAYLWESREAAEQLYTEEWQKYIKDTYGSEPSITYFDSPVIVDNLSGSIITDD
jgi:hypothetical protein